MISGIDFVYVEILSTRSLDPTSVCPARPSVAHRFECFGRQVRRGLSLLRMSSTSCTIRTEALGMKNTNTSCWLSAVLLAAIIIVVVVLYFFYYVLIRL